MNEYLSHFNSTDWVLSVIFTGFVIGVLGSLIGSYLKQLFDFLGTKVSTLYKDRSEKAWQKRQEYVTQLENDPLKQLEAHQRMLYFEIKKSNCVTWQVAVAIIFALWGISLGRFDWNVYGIFIITFSIPTFGFYYFQSQALYFVLAIGAARKNNK